MKINRLKEQDVNDIIEKEEIDLSSFKKSILKLTEILSIFQSICVISINFK